MSFVIGQRWLSHADPQLGLGIVTDSDPRRVTVMFPAVEEERTYAVANAPLSRITCEIFSICRSVVLLRTEYRLMRASPGSMT